MDIVVKNPFDLLLNETRSSITSSTTRLTTTTANGFKRGDTELKIQYQILSIKRYKVMYLYKLGWL